jgi:FMN phosphatase YigB (HAD superfamily)
MGVVTNRVFGGPRFRDEMTELGLDKYFESVAVSCDLGYMKPHPKIFQHVLDEMKIDPAETAMVGDSLRADVEAAQALGMTAVWRRVRKEDPPHEPEQVGEGPSNSAPAKRGATRAETGRALGEWSGGEGVTPDYTIWTLTELTQLPLFD